MLNEYKIFLENKGNENFWKKAKQHEYNNIDKIVLLLQNIKVLTTRNSMSLRLMGLVENLGSDNLELTEVGEMFLGSKNKQDIVDEQLLKMYLDSSINNRLNIPVFPLGVIYAIYIELDHISFEEYKIFVCWINSNDEISTVIDLIKQYRELDKTKQNKVNKIFYDKVSNLKIDNFDDNVYRLFMLFTLSSYIMTEGNRYEEIIYRTSKTSTYKILVGVLEKIKLDNYFEDLFHYRGIITKKADHDYILNPIQTLTNEDRSVLFKQIEEKRSLPDIVDIVPTMVNPKIIKRVKIVRRSKNKSSKKIDYVARDTRNRLVGLHAEKIVYKYEYNKLIECGQNELALKVTHESLTNDNLGYDITSYDVSDKDKKSVYEKHIEVKAVRGLPRTFSFFISKNELEKVKNDPNHKIYIVFNYETKDAQIWPMPHLFSDQEFIEISPVKFQVTLAIER